MRPGPPRWHGGERVRGPPRATSLPRPGDWRPRQPGPWAARAADGVRRDPASRCRDRPEAQEDAAHHRVGRSAAASWPVSLDPTLIRGRADPRCAPRASHGRRYEPACCRTRAAAARTCAPNGPRSRTRAQVLPHRPPPSNQPIFSAAPPAESDEGHPVRDGPHRKNVRRRPTLPRSHPRSTIGAVGLSFRVRNGTGRFPYAMAAETLWRCQPFPTVSREPHSERETARSVWSSPRPISTGQLHVLPRFHIRPINPVIFWGPYQVNPVGDLISKQASRLDAFSGYPFRT